MKLLPICLVLAGSLVRLSAAPAVSWDSAPFSIPPADVAAAAAQVPSAEKDNVVVLYEEDSYSYNTAGAATHRYRITYKILSRQGVSDWSTAECWWQPWHQDKPTITARIVARDGRVSQLDPKTIADVTGQSDSPDVYVDSRTLQAPLPNLEAGAVVEYVIDLNDRAPLLAAGAVERVWFGHSEPVLLRRLLVDYPAAMNVKYVVRRTPAIVPAQTQGGGRQSLRFEARDIPRLERPEDLVLWDTLAAPCIDFSTGSSWNAIAQGYAAATDEMLDGSGLKDYVRQIAASSGASGPALIAPILYRVRKDVRYTGINFGENSIIPHPPGDTLKRGYGDCKDQAVLLASALRAAGVDARLALLRSGDTLDVSSQLPGFGLFNHAIVYLPASSTWIDPTADFTPPGQLPLMDQGRQALIIDRQTSSLLLTPDPPPSANWFHEVREYRLSEDGPAAVVETTTVGGAFEEDYRYNFDRATSSASREYLEKYVKNEYDAQSLVRWAVTDPRAMDVPFTLTLEAAASREGRTDESSAVAYLRGGGLLESVPDFIKKDDTAGSPFKRTSDLRLWEPFVCEYVYHVIAPPGYRAAALPPDEAASLGPARLTKAFRLEDDGSVTATLRFDCVKRSYTAAEAADLHKAIREFSEAPASVVTFEQVGESLLASGKYQEALAEFRALVALHPAEARHRVQVSSALLAAGFGRDAQAEARRAVQLQPDSALAHSNLAWVLLHDEFGRIFSPGADLAGARAEYEAARKLDPATALYTRNLAIMDEYNGAMVRYGPGARLQDAISEYRAVEKDLKGTDGWANLYFDLMYLGRFQDIVEDLKDGASTDTLQALFVAATAATRGPAAAQKEAARLVPGAEARRKVLNLAAQFLLTVRRYSDSAELMIAGAKGTPNLTQTMGFAEFFRTLTPASQKPSSDATPQGLVVQMVRLMLGPGPSASDLEGLMASTLRSAYAVPGGERSEAEQALDYVRKEISQLQFPAETLVDIVVGMIDVQTISNGGATAALMTVPAFPSSRPSVFYMTREDGRYRLVDAEWDMSGIARECLALADAGRVADAADWFKLVRDQHVKSAAFPDFSDAPVFKLLPAAPGAEDIRRAAGYILGQSRNRKDAELAVTVLMPRWRSETDAARRLPLETSLSEALAVVGNLSDLRLVAESFVKDAPDDSRALALLSVALSNSGAVADAERLIRTRLAAKPADRALLRILADWLGSVGRYDEAIKVSTQILDSGAAELTDYNSYAWYALYAGKIDPAVLAKRQIVQRLLDGGSAALHTLVCVLADSGRILEAQEVFGRYLQMEGDGPTRAATWLAYGILSQRFGLDETAASALQQVTLEGWDAQHQGISSWKLARIHLDELKATPKPDTP